MTLVQCLENLGLTEAEAKAYVYLVKNSPATGYGISKEIGQPKGTTYRVLESLKAKGAVVTEGSSEGLCSAIPPGEFLEQLDSRFRKIKKLASDAARELQPEPPGDRIYVLTSVEQAYERCRTMLKKSRSLAFLDLHPDAVAELRSTIEETVKRGVRVVMETYAPTDLEGVWTAANPIAPDLMAHWPLRWICVCTDGAEQLVAALAREEDRLYHGIWTANRIHSFAMAGYLMHYALAVELIHLLDGGATHQEIHDAYDAWRSHVPRPYSLPGYSELESRYGIPKLHREEVE